jgi:hypothetical protein
MAYFPLDQPAEVLCGCLAETENPSGPAPFQPNDATDSRVIYQHKEET